MVWAELLSSRGTWHSRMVGEAWWSGAVGGEGAGGRRLEEAVDGGRGRPEEGRERKKERMSNKRHGYGFTSHHTNIQWC